MCWKIETVFFMGPASCSMDVSGGEGLRTYFFFEKPLQFLGFLLYLLEIQDRTWLYLSDIIFLIFFLISIFYKTVKPSHLEKLKTIQNIKNLMFQIIFIFSNWILISKSWFPSALSTVGETDFRKNAAWRNDSFPSAYGVMTSTWGRVLSGEGMSKNASNQCIF